MVSKTDLDWMDMVQAAMSHIIGAGLVGGPEIQEAIRQELIMLADHVQQFYSMGIIHRD